ncbi:hypothetical protein [Novosphingobium resinovorum]|uniref:hypothetical protein n=1 Tax=Novosphingobium resinovorum TaxID=158500 RepID=UPI002ED63011|nr:hypothetical protein [Novosphingobium resinovorum]
MLDTRTPTSIAETTVSYVSTPQVSAAAADIRDKIRAVTPLLREKAWESEKATALVPEALEALNATGFFLFAVPEELGGFAFGARDISEIASAAGYADGSAGWTGFVAGGVRTVLAFDERAVSEVLSLTKDWVGPVVLGASIFSQATGGARKVDGGFMVKGTWRYGSGAAYAAWAIVGIEWIEDDKTVRALALLKREQYEKLDDWHVMGMAATASNSIQVKEEVFVPTHRVLLMDNLVEAFASVRGRYSGLGYRMGPMAAMLTTSITTISIALGMANGCIDCFVEQANRILPFNLPYDSVAQAPSTQVVAGRARAMVNAAEALIHRIAIEIDTRAMAGTDFEPREEAFLTNDLVYAGRLCGDAIDAIQVCLGSSTASLRNPIQRFLRDVRVLLSHGAIRQDPIAEITGRHVLGLEPFKMLAGGLIQR